MRGRRMQTRVLLLALVLSACAPTAVASPTPTAETTPSATEATTPSPSPTATVECATRVLAGMTEEQRIGQLFLLGLANDQLGAAEMNAIRTYHLGSVWFVEQSTAGTAAIPRPSARTPSRSCAGWATRASRPPGSTSPVSGE